MVHRGDRTEGVRSMDSRDLLLPRPLVPHAIGRKRGTSGGFSSNFAVWIGEIAPDLFEKDKTVTCPLVAQRKALYHPNTHLNCAHDIRQNPSRPTSNAS